MAATVLAITLKQERDRSAEQASAERELVFEQLRAEREAEREHRRVEAFGDFIGAMKEYLSFPSDRDELRLLQRRSDAALQRWMLYVDPSDDAVALGVAGHRSSVVAGAIEAAREARANGVTRVHHRPIRAVVKDLAKHGREWHRTHDGSEQVRLESAAGLAAGARLAEN